MDNNIYDELINHGASDLTIIWEKMSNPQAVQKQEPEQVNEVFEDMTFWKFVVYTLPVTIGYLSAMLLFVNFGRENTDGILNKLIMHVNKNYPSGDYIGMQLGMLLSGKIRRENFDWQKFARIIIQRARHDHELISIINEISKEVSGRDLEVDEDVKRDIEIFNKNQMGKLKK